MRGWQLENVTEKKKQSPHLIVFPGKLRKIGNKKGGTTGKKGYMDKRKKKKKVATISTWNSKLNNVGGSSSLSSV